jgi:hypothetical protein
LRIVLDNVPPPAICYTSRGFLHHADHLHELGAFGVKWRVRIVMVNPANAPQFRKQTRSFFQMLRRRCSTTCTMSCMWCSFIPAGKIWSTKRLLHLYRHMQTCCACCTRQCPSQPLLVTVRLLNDTMTSYLSRKAGNSKHATPNTTPDNNHCCRSSKAKGPLKY